MGIVRPGVGGGWCVKANLIIFSRGGNQNKFKQKSRGAKRIFFFLSDLCSEYIFFEWEGKAGRGVIAFTAEA